MKMLLLLIQICKCTVAVFSIHQTNLAGLLGLNSQNIGIIYAYSQVT